MVGKNLVRSSGRALGASSDAIGSAVATVDAVGTKLSPVLAVLAAFTGAYNTTIHAQCELGTLK